MRSSSWNPVQYRRFRSERTEPFYDLLGQISPDPDMRVVDLGCGTGELTQILHDRLRARYTLGIDNSDTMFGETSAISTTGLEFRMESIESFSDPEPWDLLFSNAALQWVSDHKALFPRLAAMVKPGGQIAVQMPANHLHPSHVAASDVAASEAFRADLDGHVHRSPLLMPEEYAWLLYDSGFRQLRVRMQIYMHELESREAVVEWMKGSLLTDYLGRLPESRHAEFIDAYARRLAELMPERKPFPYAFKRVLMVARKPAPAP